MGAYMKSWYQKRRAQAVAALGACCARCPETEDLQFDHIDPATKTMTIAKMWTASEARFQEELAKCQLLCWPHHLEKTLAEKGFEPGKGTHGTSAAYRYCGPPKCDECKRAKSEYVRHWKAQRAASSIAQSYSLLRRRLGVRVPRGAPKGGWRNRQTRWSQIPVPSRREGSNPSSPTIAGSSNGRTAGSGPVDRSSSLCPAAALAFGRSVRGPPGDGHREHGRSCASWVADATAPDLPALVRHTMPAACVAAMPL